MTETNALRPPRFQIQQKPGEEQLIQFWLPLSPIFQHHFGDHIQVWAEDEEEVGPAAKVISGAWAQNTSNSTGNPISFPAYK